ncbi:DNA-processing protein DprA [Sessilibacter corallicola]|uniref:DNA-processing protein DprA n=1 Tax=Sessilibacter corallicola TaxID=2904075 RepID=UPI001E4B69CD|nr:DNA-processing protein DprA [Sessilibacter corallicola]MCE2028089.1 DNA-processing protein DprA [Sessilibacter corallicola]
MHTTLEPPSHCSTHQLYALILEQLAPKSPSRLTKTLRELGDAQALLENPSVLSPLLKPESFPSYREFLETPESAAITSHAFTTWEALQRLNTSVIPLGSPQYPTLLAEIPDPPKLLYCQGNPTALHLPAIAIVGGRNCTSQGAANAHDFSKHLAASGFCVVSGLALGIDTQAHLGALNGEGATVAVMATGIDQIYPAANRRLAEDIISKGGCVMTEFPLGAKPLRSSFPKRNRIISGLSLGTLVVEAKLKSGSLITANTAVKQNREVFAIPGSIHNPMAKGCHQLIKTGAKLVESSQDIIDELKGALSIKVEELNKLQINDTSTNLNKTETEQNNHPILAVIEFDSITVDELAEKTQLPIEQLQTEILMLELDGLISHIDGVIERKF